MIPAVAAVFIKEDFMQNKKQEWRPGNMLYPVPAVMVSCQRENEKPNIITVAWQEQYAQTRLCYQFQSEKKDIHTG